MAQAADPWYVRLPDGRVFRAASTMAVRHHLDSGKIPPESWVRRSPEEEWVSLEWAEEFADLVSASPVRSRSAPEQEERGWRMEDGGSNIRSLSSILHPPSSIGSRPPSMTGISSRLDPLVLQTVGVRGLVDELLAALDSALFRNKLAVGCVAGVLIGAFGVVAATLHGYPLADWSFLPWLVLGVAVWIIAGVSHAALTQLTYLELSRLRPATLAEAKPGLAGYTLRLLMAYLVAGGGLLLAVFLLRLLPEWLGQAPGPNSLADILGALRESFAVVALMLEVVLWPILAFTMLLGPILIIEDCSVFSALRQWSGLLRQHLGRVFLYEALAAALAFIATLPFTVPLALAITGRLGPTGGLGTATEYAFLILAGLVSAPLITYLSVANVFIYLNLRYQR